MLVTAAVAVMIALGMWQLRRAEWKQELIERYASADRLPPIAWPAGFDRAEALPLFRRASGTCAQPRLAKAVAGANRAGETGYVFLVDCAARAGSAGSNVSTWNVAGRNPPTSPRS